MGICCTLQNIQRCELDSGHLENVNFAVQQSIDRVSGEVSSGRASASAEARKGICYACSRRVFFDQDTCSLRVVSRMGDDDAKARFLRGGITLFRLAHVSSAASCLKMRKVRSLQRGREKT